MIESEENEITDNREIEEGKHYNSNEIEILYDINIATEEILKIIYKDIHIEDYF